MYVYKSIGFRPIEKDDLETLLSLRNDMSTFLNLGNPEMVSIQGQMEWWNSDLQKKNDKRFSLYNCDTMKLIGIFRLNNIDLVNSNCEIGIDILPEFRKQGNGYNAYMCALSYLFLHLNFNLVFMKVADYNSNAKNLYDRIGFIRTGYFKSYLYRYGKYWDYLIYCMTREKYTQISKD